MWCLRVSCRCRFLNCFVLFIRLSISTSLSNLYLRGGCTLIALESFHWKDISEFLPVLYLYCVLSCMLEICLFRSLLLSCSSIFILLLYSFFALVFSIWCGELQVYDLVGGSLNRGSLPVPLQFLS